MFKKLFIEIKADTNDGDYVTSRIEILPEEIEYVKPLINEIKKFTPYQKGRFTHRHNFPYGECLREDLGELSVRDYYVEEKGIEPDMLQAFMEYIPYSEHGIHTIESIIILESSEEKLL